MKSYCLFLFFFGGVSVTTYAHNILPLNDSTATYRQACTAFKNKDWEKAILLFTNELQTAETNHQPQQALQICLDLGATFAKAGDMPAMEELLETAITKCKPEWANEFGALVWLKTREKPYSIARPLLEKAWAKMQNQPSSLLKAYLAYGIGHTFLEEEEFDKAIQWYSTAQTEYKKQSRTDVRILAKIYNELGGSYDSKEDMKNAAFFYKEALRVSSPHETEIKTTADILYNMTSIFEAEGRHQATLLACRMALRMEKSLEKPSIEKMADEYLVFGNTYKRMGDFLKAEDMYQQANDLFAQLEDTKHQTLLYISLTDLYIRLNELETAQKMANKGLEIANTPETRAERADLLLLLANIQQENTQTNAARELYKQAIDLSNTLNTPIRTASAYLHLIPIYLQEKNTTEAANLLENSLTILKTQNLPKYPLWATYYQHLAAYTWQADTANWTKAEAYYLQAINACLSPDKELKNKQQKIDFKGVIYTNELMKILNSIGQFYQTNGAKPQAVIAYQTAIQYQVYLRKQLFVEESKMRISSLITPIAQKAFPLAFELYSTTQNDFWLNKALQFAEADKAGALNDLIEFKQREKETPEYTAQQQLIYDLQKKRQALKQEEERTAFNADTILQLRAQIETISNQLMPALSSKETMTEEQLISIPAIQQTLQSDELMLQYYNNDTAVWLLSIAPKKTAFYRLDILPDSLQNKVATIQQSLKKPNNTAYLPLLNELYTLLIAPIEADSTAKTLIIAPHHCLSELPFDLLLTDAQKPTSYLLYKHPICYAYSAQSYINGTAQHQYAANVGAFAPIKYAIDSLPTLSNAEAEVKDIAAVCKADVFLYENASEQNFKEQASNYGVLLLATHGYQHPTHYEYSQFLLQKNKKQDSFLNTYEIATQPLNAELTVLSACNSGAGTYKKGEGVLSLARGFSTAGCPNIILTQWQVADKQYSRLIHLLFTELIKGMPKHIALQQAKIQYLKEADRLSAAPFFWAGTVLLGNTQAVHSLSAL